MTTDAITEAWEAFLAKHKVNQTGAAKRAGISPPMISAYKSGVSRPSPDTLRRIAEAFGEDYATLRRQLYPSADTDDDLRSGGMELPRPRPDRDLVTTRLACLTAAATVLAGTNITADAVTALAATFEEWVVRP